MKKLHVLILCSALVFMTGCGTLIPKTVELFQKKVQAVPTLTASDKETQKEAASLASKRANDTMVAAISNEAPAAVITPAADTVSLTKSVSESLGPPLSPWTAFDGPATELSAKLDHSVAKLDKKLAVYSADTQPLVGKKIEGTGFFQIPYFVWLLMVGAGILILFVVGKALWTAVQAGSFASPAISLGSNVISMGAKDLSAAFS